MALSLINFLKLGYNEKLILVGRVDFIPSDREGGN